MSNRGFIRKKKDKVLEQLEYSRVPNTGIVGYHKVVEIVKGGGIDGNTNT